MKRYLVSGALAAILAAGPALAAEQSTQQTPAETQSQAAEKPAMQSQGAMEFVTAQQKTDWLGNSLIGRTVKNPQDESLGAINDVVLDEKGQVVAVLIGVGGFLGIGGKDVGVQFSDLQFKEQPAAPTSSTRPPAQSPGGSSGSPLAGGGGIGGSQSSAPQAPREDYSHSNMMIVLNVTKEQLEAAPAFRRLGQKAEAPKESSERLSPSTEGGKKQ